MSAIIRIEGVSRRFGDMVAVDDVSLDIAEGAFFTLLGPSGCGKTTLLRMLAGFEVPDSGRILIDGVDVGRVPPSRRPVNMVFQSYAIFPHLSVAGNVAYGLRIAGVARADIARRVDEALALVKLPGLGDRRPDQLSGGQRQRVALARALVNRPRVLLLDEPLSALDAKLREAMQTELATLQRTVGITFVMVTHDQDEALALSDRVAVMDRGTLRQVGSAAELYDRPQSRFVADFLGTANLFATRVDAATGRATVAALDADLAVPVGTAPAAGPLWLALRPEAVTLFAAAELVPGGWHHCPATIVNAAYLGASTLVTLALAGGGELRSRCRMVIGGEPGFVPGAPVVAGWDPAAATLVGN